MKCSIDAIGEVKPFNLIDFNMYCVHESVESIVKK